MQRTVEQIVDIAVGGQDFLPDPGLAAPSAVSREEPGQGGFRTVLRRKKCGGRRAGGCEGARPL